MKLSIIVPVYNVKDYLTDCVESLLAQTIDDYEIILVDDGATDGSGELVSEYAAKYPDMITALHIDNGGQGRARNFGIDLARGEFLGFVDSDDRILPDMYEKLYNRAQETGADVAVCDMMAHFPDGREEYTQARIQQHRLSAAGSASNKIFRRSRVKDIRFPQGLWYEDFYFSAMLLMLSERTEYVKEPLYIYRRGQQSTMNNNNAAKNLDIIKIMDMLERYMLSQGYKDEFEFFVINHVVLDTISRLAAQTAENRRSVIAQVRSYAKEKIPDLSKCRSFKNESMNRRIIMRLNYSGLEDLAQLILKAKKLIK